MKFIFALIFTACALGVLFDAVNLAASYNTPEFAGWLHALVIKGVIGTASGYFIFQKNVERN